MVARRGEILRQSLEDRFVIVMNAAGLAMHNFRRSNYLAAKRISDCLMSQANAEYGNFPRKAFNNVNADPGFLRRAGPGRNHDALRLLCRDLVERDLIVAMHFQLFAQLPEELREVVSEGIVVVEKQNHCLRLNSLFS